MPIDDTYSIRIMQSTKHIALTVTRNEFGQRTWTGQIVLKQGVEMRNKANDGLEPSDRRWNKAYFRMVPIGAVCSYEVVETRSGFYHTIMHKAADAVFYASKRTDTFAGQAHS